MSEHIPYERTSVTAFNGKLPRCEMREYVHEPVTAEWTSTGMHYMRGTVRVVHLDPPPRGFYRHLRNIMKRRHVSAPLAVDGAAYRRRTRRRRP